MVKKSAKRSKEDIVIEALAMAAARGWANVGLSDIAQETGLSLAQLHEHFEDKSDIIGAFGRMIDRQVLEAVGSPGEEESPRDRLFDVLMERYEALNDYRPGFVAVLESFSHDPKQALIGLPHLCRSMSWMMEAVGLHTDGLQGAVKLAGLSALYIKVLYVWKSDESADLAKTMAALDKDLGRAEQAANLFAF